MALVGRGRSAAEETRHLDIKYFCMKEQVEKGVAIVTHLLLQPEDYGRMIDEQSKTRSGERESAGFRVWV
jgi:hypothetical protein